jgi:hypothetical protein
VPDSLRWRGPRTKPGNGLAAIASKPSSPDSVFPRREDQPRLVVDVGALQTNIVEDRGKPGVDGSQDHVVALALEVVTVCLYFSSPQIPLLNGAGFSATSRCERTA